MGSTFPRIAALIFVAFLLSCEEYRKQPSFVDVPTERSVLVDDIHSYSRVDQVRTLLGDLAAKWEVVENSGQASSKDSRPPFQIYTALVHGYEHLGFKGDLKLTFFNDRLMSAVFYPNDFAGYISRASITFPDLREKNSVQVPPFLQVTLGTDYQQRKYVSWEDARLVEEMSIWIRRYS